MLGSWLMLISLGTIWLLFQFVSYVTAPRTGQSDLDVFLWLYMIGIPTVLTSILTLFIAYIVSIKTVDINLSLLKNPLVITCGINIFAPPILLGALFYVR